MRNGKLALENLIRALFHFEFHLDGLGGRIVVVKQFAGQTGGLDGGRNVYIQGTLLVRGQGAEGAFIKGLLAVVEDSHGGLLNK